MSDRDLERELRATLRQREADVRDLAATPVVGDVVRRTRRHQIVTALAAVGVATALVAASVAGASALLRSSERRVPVGPVRTPSVSIGPVAACPPGSTPDEPGPVDQARPRPSMMAFDRDSGRIVLLEGRAHVTTTWTFDVCTNTWQQMSPDQEPRGLRGGFGRLVYDADSDLTIALLLGRRVWAYDPESDTWTEKGRAPIDSVGIPAYDRVSGLVVLRQTKSRRLAPGRFSHRTWFWTYDVDNDVWVEIHDVNIPTWGQAAYQDLVAGAEQFVYDTSVGRFVGFTAIGPETPATWTFDLPTATWSLMQATPPTLGSPWSVHGGEAAYDEEAGMTVVFARGFVGGYDASADRWMTLYGHPYRGGSVPPGPLNRMGHQMVYDPVNERLVVYGGEYARSSRPCCVFTRDVWAFDVATREWTRLLAPSESQA